jgi:predicted ATPase/DNA-binding SARP family transcriptional activator/DNA-binding CsgD family transcriptional regulator
VTDRRSTARVRPGSNSLTGDRPEAVRVRLLGGFGVAVGSRTITESEWRLRKAAALVKLLALAPGHRLHREQIVDLLWPELAPKAGSNNLRRAMHAARGVLDPERERDAGGYLASRGRHVVLCPEGNLWVDAEAFEEFARYARRSREPQAYEAALSLYGGELLPEDRYEGWAEGHRRRLRETYLYLLSGLALAHEERGDHGSAVEALRKATREEPTNEEAHARLMRLYALSGRKAEALRQYGRLEEALYGTLGARPGVATRRLRDEIAAGRLPPRGAEAAVRPGGPPNPAKHNLPEAKTTFVGREREVVEVKRALAMTSLLTLTGTGGCGKTRLAVEVGRDLAGVYPDGAWLVELASLSEGALLPQALAGALGVREQPGRSLLDVLTEALRRKATLLILDNCEHLADAAARFAEFLTESCPSLRVLATSRAPLGATGELAWRVPSLSAPGGQGSLTVEELEGYESARLFVDRARGRHPDFRLTPENASAVARVCAALEGIPLAIELAAARVGKLSVEQIAERLGRSLMLLKDARTAHHRHRTLRAALEWSYDLLGGPEQELFGRLSVFAGGFSLEAAESVGVGGSIAEEDVLDLLGTLVEKSLVVVEERWEKGARYRMLEPIRQYAREKLQESGEAGEAQDRQAACFLAFAERAEPELRGRGQLKWLGRLEEDNANLRAAMNWLLEKGEIEDAVRLSYALWIFWLIHGHQSEGRRWIEGALSRGESLDTHARARALLVQASTYYGLGDPEWLERIAEEAAALFRRVGDDIGLATVLGIVAAMNMQRGDTERAIELFEEAIALGREAGERWGPSGALGHLGAIYLEMGDHERAARCFEEGLALSREIGNRLGEATALYGLAMAARLHGDLERATEFYAEALESAAEAGDRANAAYSLEGLAQVAAERGHNERAARLFGAAEASLDAAGGALYTYAQDRSARERAVEALCSLMGEEAFSAERALGQAMSPGEAFEYAVSGRETVPSTDPSTLVVCTSGGRRATLTRREEEVAALVARGLTNRQIGSELSISEHTVANHVARMLRRLGLRSRAQLSAWITGRRTPR